MTAPVGQASVLLAAPDKFRGTLSARQAAEAIARGSRAFGGTVCQMPLSDGGEGLLEVLEVLGGEEHGLEVTGPLGTAVTARWRQVGDVALVEMAEASGLLLAGGAVGNDPVGATTRGTGELIAAAARSLTEAGGRHGNRSGTGPAGTVVVGLGGSATSDGGLGALMAIDEAGGLGGVALVGACDVRVPFDDAVTRFARQKGADDDQLVELAARFRLLARRYEEEYGVDVRGVEGAGAAGGLGGAIAVLGGTLRSGYDVVAELLGFHQALAASDLVVTGEGSFDSTSFAGKAVGSVVRDGAASSTPVLIVAGRAEAEATTVARAAGAEVASLSDRFGEERALSDTARCVELVVAEWLSRRPSSRG